MSLDLRKHRRAAGHEAPLEYDYTSRTPSRFVRLDSARQRGQDRSSSSSHLFWSQLLLEGRQEVATWSGAELQQRLTSTTAACCERSPTSTSYEKRHQQQRQLLLRRATYRCVHVGVNAET